MTGPGWSAEEEYRIRRRRRRGIRSAAWLVALATAAGGSWLAASAAGVVGVSGASGLPGLSGLSNLSGLFGLSGRTGALGGAVALWATAATTVLLLRWRGFGGRDVERWQRGSEGETRTASALARLPARSWALRHDLRIPGSRANVDHVVVGRSGIWVVDTKTTRAPVRAAWRSVRFGSRRLDTASLRWESEVVADRLQAVLGWPVAGAVRPVVSVHGEGLRRRGGRAGGVPVVAGDRLVRRIRRGRRRLRRSEVAAVAEALDVAFPPGGSASSGPGPRASRRAGGYSARMTPVISDGAGRSYG